MRIDDTLAGLRHRWVKGGAGGHGPDLEVVRLTHDSRRAGPGAIFFALRGLKADGLGFAEQARGAGAVALAVGPGRGEEAAASGFDRIVEVEGDERTALAVMARNLHGRPDEALSVVGVTGTNGKTTTCRIAALMLRAGGIRTGWLGTISHSLGDEELAAERTTPEAPEIHEYLARMKEAGCRACVMEVSSHAIDLKRVHGMRFAVAVFTNLTRDHLDYHRDMESYYRVKASLFTGRSRPEAAVINVDDPYGARLAAELGAGGGTTWQKMSTLGESRSATLRIASIRSDAGGVQVRLSGPEGEVELGSPLAGRPNAFNVTAAAAAARALGVSWDAIRAGASAVMVVPGRLEKVSRGDVDVFVDYAHTDDALENLLQTVRPISRGRVLLVFGCGGDRDRSKRPLMGAHAARLADELYVTSDNPRGEAPEAIIEQILAGVEQARRSGRARVAAEGVHVDPDRARSIHAAIRAARSGDLVVIAGKGHETYQILGESVIHFDDREVAREALARRERNGAGHDESE